MILRIVLPLVLVSVLAGNALATSEIVRDPKAWDFEPLQYSDLIVRGVVTAVSDTTVPGEDFWMEPKGTLPPRSTRLLVVRVNVEERRLNALAAIDEVRHIEKYYPPKLSNNIARGLINARPGAGR